MWKYFDFWQFAENFVGAQPLRIMFGKVDGLIRAYDGTTYLVLFGPKKCDTISYKSKKWYYTFFFHNYAKFKIDSNDSLPLEQALTLHNVIMFINSVFNKDRNHNTLLYVMINTQYITIYQYDNTFLEKHSYQLAKKIMTNVLIV